MIDTIRIRIDDVMREELEEINLDWDITYNKNKGTIKSMKAKYGNINLYARGISLYITVSLPKYYIGNNVDRLSFAQTKEALIKLEKDLDLLDIGINVNEGIVTRLDYSSCIALENSTDRYLPMLEYCSTFIRNVISPTSIDFSQENRRRLKFYDKVAEVKKKREHLPQNWVGENILRYELMMTQTIMQLFKKDLLVKDLFNPETHLTLLEEWKKRYESVVKGKDCQFNESAIDNTKDLKNFFASVGITSFGLGKALEMINRLPKKHNNSKKRKNDGLELIMNKNYIIETDLAQEMDRKIDEVYQSVKQELIQQQ